ncbi:hypothetical protein BSL82_02010 [Tardibacter chloracetimidivorans]|uniref:Uncharacterized protein n=1 Tax=Tardibacter chloracetimidivorans TaxID=1921510 RepID=A0A1L3ZRH6_9SPHN|nr:tetratricopeptide repeat protein [Tardibacter chloracetimidivorans]API58227.1 hypothetical protein BSL82_02010 [Tardibacter chloracetimidivorans]
MRKISSLALGLALAMGAAGGAAVVATPAAAQKAQKQKSLKLGRAVQSPLAEAQKLQEAGNLDAALAKINEAAAKAETPDEKFVIGQFTYNIAAAKKDDALLEKATRAMLESGSAPEDMKKPLMRNLAAFSLQRKDYAGALTQFKALAAAYPDDAEIVVSLAELYHANKQPAEAVTTLQKAIQTKKATNEAVPETWYKRMLAIAYDAKRMDLAVPASLDLVSAYPSADNWRDSLIIFRDTGKLDDQATLDLMRLMRAAGAMKGEADYYEYANSAYMKGLPGEAKAVIDEGIAKKMLNPGKQTFAELSRLSAGKVSADKASLPKLATQAKSAANGKLALGTADAYLGYADYAKAAELYQVALQKGGVEANVVNTRLGIALARSGQKDAAAAAFAKVSGEPRATIAKFWQAWLNQGA